MTGTARQLANLVTGIVLVVSGIYLIVYLYRWEWNRALAAGLFFVAAEIAVTSRAMFIRLRNIERRLDELATQPSLQTLEQVRATAPLRPNRFAWLERRAGSMNVFVPVLLGAGVLLSAFATIVERLGAATAVPVAEQRLARRLDRLALPAGGLLSDAPPVIASRRSTGGSLRVRLFAALAVGLLTIAAVDVIADSTQSRPDPPVSGSTEISIEIRRRDNGLSVVSTTEALFVACRHMIDETSRMSELSTTDDVARFVVTPAIGKHKARRFVGCLEDGTFDRVSADVDRVRHIKATDT